MTQLQTVRGVATTIAVNPQTGMTEIRYHNTVVVAFDANQIVLNSGRWRTATTKVRMNQASNQFGLGYWVYQQRGEWFVNHGKKVYDFYDGMTLARAG
jgi:hypothetical protein